MEATSEIVWSHFLGGSSERSLVDVMQRSDFESRRKALHGPEMRLSRRFCQVLMHLILLENRRLREAATSYGEQSHFMCELQLLVFSFAYPNNCHRVC